MFYIAELEGLHYNIYDSELNLELDDYMNLYKNPIKKQCNSLKSISMLNNYNRFPCISFNGLPTYKHIESMFDRMDLTYDYYVRHLYTDNNVSICEIITLNPNYSVDKINCIDMHTILKNMTSVKISLDGYVWGSDRSVNAYRSYMNGIFDEFVGKIQENSTDKIVSQDDKLYQLYYDYYHLSRFQDWWIYRPNILETISQTDPNNLYINKFLINTEQVIFEGCIFDNYHISRTRIFVKIN